MPEPIRLVFIVGIVVVDRGRDRPVHDAQLRSADPHPAAAAADASSSCTSGSSRASSAAVGLRHLPILAILTGLIWMTEGLRLYIVVLALGFGDVSLGLSGAIFVALIGSLLTAIPLSPAGLGFAQAGVIGVLTVAYGVPLAEATAITILDWVISVLSIIVIGAVVYVVSPMPRGLGHIKQPPAASSAPTAA